MKLRLFTFLLALCLSAGAHAANPQIEMKTSHGSITLELFPDKAPKTVKNFLEYVDKGFYNGTVFHRVIDNFMIQGGGFDPYLREKVAYRPVYNEANNGLKNEAYTLAMARKRNPHSAVAQFFINVKNNPFLDHTAPTVTGWGYTVFGKVVKGQEVVMKISKVPTGQREPFASDVPLENVVIEEIRRLP
jgi:cyclophilin family peptidyl-prolyl cis-trans isomerase